MATLKSNDMNFNARMNRAELEAYHALCRELDTTASREFRIFVRQQLQASGLWVPGKGLVSDEKN